MPNAHLPILEMTGLLIAGLALFLFGLEQLTQALKAIAGPRLKSLLSSLTASRFRGVLAGAGVTALLNSSTITTVLLVGFVSAGLMTLAQAIPMIMGANIGSTITAQLVAFDLSAIMPYMLGTGFMMHTFGKRELLRQSGSVILGLGLLFLGIKFMGDAMHPLRSYEPFIIAMHEMENPLLGILIGAAFTAIVQSSAATLAIVITLASQGLMPLESGIAIVLGANVGTCGTALLAAIGKPPEALQVALVHLMFNVFGATVLAFFIPVYADFVRWISPSSMGLGLDQLTQLAADTPRQVANAHTIFSVAATLVLIGFTGVLERLAQRLVPSKPHAWQAPSEPRFLDKTLLPVPALAIPRIQLELVSLGEQMLSLVRRSVQVAVAGNEHDIATLIEEDKDADQLGTEILSYIGSLADTEMPDLEGRKLVDLTRITACLDAIREVAATSLTALSQRRLIEGVDMASLHTGEDTATAHFYAAVIDSLQQAIALIVASDADAVNRVVDAKSAIEAKAAAARETLMAQLSLDTPDDVLNFRLSHDMIEQFNEIARMARAIAKATRYLKSANDSPKTSGEKQSGLGKVMSRLARKKKRGGK
jgi:phosphate:Na+ symporter